MRPDFRSGFTIHPAIDAGLSCRRAVLAGMVLLMLAAISPCGQARQLSVQECIEGSDFIRNAALARDNGMPASKFLDKIREDIEMIQSFPPQLRWFVQDEEDAAMLIAAATEVFQRPQAPISHQSDFFKTCLGKTRADDKPLSRL